MKKRLLPILAVTVAAAAMAGGASAANALPPGYVSPIACNGGPPYNEVLANNPVVLKTGWFTKTQGLARLFLGAVTTNLEINGNPVADANSYFQAPEKVTTGGWQTNWVYPTGITLTPGDTMTLTFDLILSHPIIDGVTYDTGDSGKLYVFPAGSLFGVEGPITCTITAVSSF